MNQPMPEKLVRATVALVVMAAWSLSAQAPLTIEGLADRQYSGYVDSVAFRVPSTAGYSYSVLLDTKPVPTDAFVTVNAVDYHELHVWRTNTSTLQTTNRRIQFIVRASSRGTTEVGIPAWTPYPTIPSASNEFTGGELRVAVPQAFPAGYQIPVVAWLYNSAGAPLRANGELTLGGSPAVTIRRGVGSALLPGNRPAGSSSLDFGIQGLATNKNIEIEASPTWTSVAGVLNGATSWPENSRILATGNLTVPAGGTLTIGAGTIIRLNSRVDITNNGTVVINGTTERPVVLMPSSPSQPWGGFVMRDGTGVIDATGTIFTGCGAEPLWFGANGNPGSHRREQALFYVDDDQAVTLTDCAAIYMAGQLGHSRAGGEFVFNRFLMQRCTTGGEYTGANFTVNDSAFIEAPAETPQFVDGDNDLLYLVSGRHAFTNTLFGWCKDDGIDSGASGAGVFNYEKCWFEGAFHEGNSLSGNGKDVRHRNGVFINCGQALEAGYEGPTGRLDHCFVTANVIGGRFGDNYDWTYNGFLRVTNSILIHNHRDVWGYNWADWTYRLAQMDVRNNLLTTANALHPTNSAWNPVAHAQELADFMSIPVDSAVGVGIALWSSQGTLRDLANGVPVRLSSFTTVPVAVGYSVDAGAENIAQGTLQFEPGETVKLIHLAGSLPEGAALLRVTLFEPQNAQITGRRTASYAGSLIPRGAVWTYLDTGVDQLTAWRALDFNDSGWETGAAQLGFGDTDQVTTISDNDQLTTYFRRKLVAADPTAFASLSMWLLRDDAAVVHFNGQEVFRSSGLPSRQIQPVITYTNRSATTFENQEDTATLSATNLVAGTNIVAVEIHQESAGSSDVSFDFELIAVPLPRVHLMRLGLEQMLFWDDPAYSLQSATDVTGPWLLVNGASSPYQLIPSENVRFYRLRR
jgi:hypothetical protein